MSNNGSRMLNLRMDVKDMLKYHEMLERKREKALSTNNLELVSRLNKQLDVMDMMFEVVWISTVEEVAPQFKALTGGDFDIESLKLALPQYASANIVDSTQVTMEFTEEQSEGGTPAVNEENFMEEIKKLLSKSFIKNIPAAIAIYNERTGKNLLPADAYTEIKDALPECKPIRMWDNYLSTQFRINGPLYAYFGIKKHLQDWSDTEIGRLCEDAIKRRIAWAETPFTEAKELEDLLVSMIDKDRVRKWKEDPKSVEIKGLYIRKHTEEELKKLGLTQAQYEEKQIGRIIAAMTPRIRVQMEKSGGRIPYVEKGYPAK